MFEWAHNLNRVTNHFLLPLMNLCINCKTLYQALRPNAQPRLVNAAQPNRWQQAVGLQRTLTHCPYLSARALRA